MTDVHIAASLQVSALATSAQGGSNTLAQAKLAQLSKQWGVAEAVLLAQGRTDEAIQMYTQAYKWEDAIKYVVCPRLHLHQTQQGWLSLTITVTMVSRDLPASPIVVSRKFDTTNSFCN